VKEIRTFTVDYRIHEDQALAISPLLEVNSVKVNGVEIRNYALQPSQRRWPNGPYTMISREHGFHSEDVVEIDGLWGKYEELMEIDLTVSQETETKKTMIVSNGGLISPGMVLLIDDEQEFITCGNGSKGSPAPTLLTSKLNGEIDDVNSSQIIEIDDGSEVFEDEVIRVESEDLLIERVSGNSLTVQRGWNQTLITNHADDEPLSVYRTYVVLRGVNGTNAAVHNEAAIQEYMVPDDLNYLCRQIAGLMTMKVRSGFQGRVGNAETGESMYFSEFPPNQIKFIEENYAL
jgi:hypothetical protein